MMPGTPSIAIPQPPVSPPDGRAAAAAAPRTQRRGAAAPRVSPSEAVTQRPLLLLLPVLMLVVPALLLALTRPPVYGAESRLVVGNLGAGSQAIQSAQALAETYSRIVDSEVIVTRVAEELDLTPAAVHGRISGSAIPESALIRIEADAARADDAILLADAAAVALQEYAAGGDGGDVLDQYEQAVRELRSAELEEARLNATPGADAARLVGDAQAAAARARLRVQGLAARYADGGGADAIRIIGDSVGTGSDRRSQLQLAVGGSLVLGLMLGVALATFVVNRESARRFAASLR